MQTKLAKVDSEMAMVRTMQKAALYLDELDLRRSKIDKLREYISLGLYTAEEMPNIVKFET